MTATGPSEAWYLDSAMSGTEWHWDGTQWTEHARHLQTPPPPTAPTPEKDGVTLAGKLAFMLMALIAVGGVLGATHRSPLPDTTK